MVQTKYGWTVYARFSYSVWNDGARARFRDNIETNIMHGKRQWSKENYDILSIPLRLHKYKRWDRWSRTTIEPFGWCTHEHIYYCKSNSLHGFDSPIIFICHCIFVHSYGRSQLHLIAKCVFTFSFYFLLLLFLFFCTMFYCYSCIYALRAYPTQLCGMFL